MKIVPMKNFPNLQYRMVIHQHHGEKTCLLGFVIRYDSIQSAQLQRLDRISTILQGAR